MKVTLILTTLLGAAIANPVAVVNTDSKAVVKRNADIDARQVLPGLPSLPISSLPGLSILDNLGLPGIPNLPITPANIVQVLTQLFEGIIGAIANILQGLTGAGSIPGLPGLPSIPGLPAPGIPTGNITIEQLTALIGALQAQLTNVTNIGNNLPSGLSLAQLQNIQAIIAAIQTQLGPLLVGLPGLPTSNIPGGTLPSLGNLTGLLGGLTGILTGILGLILPLLFGIFGPRA